MESFLVDRWTRGLVAERTIDEASVALATELTRREARGIGLSEADAMSLATVASELGHNQLRHARLGVLAVHAIERCGVRGLEVVAADAGDGIDDVMRLLADDARAGAESLGIGLAGVTRLADEVDFDVRIDEGTCVWARKFVASVPRAKAVGLVGRPIDGELRAGDDAGFVRLDDGTLVLALADGLGHGAEARAASSAAVDHALARPDRPPEEILAEVHHAIARSRGAVMAIARLAPGGALDVAIAGNVAVRTAGRKPGSDRHYAGPSFALGMPGAAPRMRAEHDVVGSHELLVAFSDGTSTRLAVDVSLFSVPPLVAARKLLDAFSDGRDDALIAVVR